LTRKKSKSIFPLREIGDPFDSIDSQSPQDENAKKIHTPYVPYLSEKRLKDLEQYNIPYGTEPQLPQNFQRDLTYYEGLQVTREFKDAIFRIKAKILVKKISMGILAGSVAIGIAYMNMTKTSVNEAYATVKEWITPKEKTLEELTEKNRHTYKITLKEESMTHEYKTYEHGYKILQLKVREIEKNSGRPTQSELADLCLSIDKNNDNLLSYEELTRITYPASNQRR
jgi:hypothetical protein